MCDVDDALCSLKRSDVLCLDDHGLGAALHKLKGQKDTAHTFWRLIDPIVGRHICTSYKMPKFSLEANKTYQILKAAEEGGYGVLAPVIYNVPDH